MHILKAFLQLVRFKNLLIMCLTQVVAYFFLSSHISLQNLLLPRFLFLVLATLLVGAAGYIINDYLDVKLDLINKPNKVIVGQLISRRWTMFLHLSMNLIALMLGLLVGTKVTISIVLASVLLWIYSVSLKRQFLIGNILVSALSAFVIIINFIYDNSIELSLTLAYSFFAFTLTLIREIIKDTEDIRGDGKFNCKTIPIVIGVRKTKLLLIALNASFTICVLGYTFFSAASFPFSHKVTNILFVFYMLLFVVVPLIVLTIYIHKADTTKDFERLSSMTKIIMVAGVLSMVFWRL